VRATSVHVAAPRSALERHLPAQHSRRGTPLAASLADVASFAALQWRHDVYGRRWTGPRIVASPRRAAGTSVAHTEAKTGSPVLSRATSRLGSMGASPARMRTAGRRRASRRSPCRRSTHSRRPRGASDAHRARERTGREWLDAPREIPRCHRHPHPDGHGHADAIDRYPLGPRRAARLSRWILDRRRARNAMAKRTSRPRGATERAMWPCVRMCKARSWPSAPRKARAFRFTTQDCCRSANDDGRLAAAVEHRDRGAYC
jgi:hypothetical protein